MPKVPFGKWNPVLSKKQKLSATKAASERDETVVHDTSELQQSDACAHADKRNTVTLIGWNNKVKAGLTAGGEFAVQRSTSYVSYSCTQSCSAFTVKAEEMSDASHCHALSEKLKRDSEMCLDSFGVTNHSRVHHPSTDRAVTGVIGKDWHLHRITSVVYSDRPLFFLR